MPTLTLFFLSHIFAYRFLAVVTIFCGVVGKRIFGKSSPQLQRHAKPSRNDNFADSNEIGRIYGVSPQRLEVMRHKSAEDLLKLTKNNNNKEHQPKTPANVDNKVKSNGVTIEGDAKLVSLFVS